MKKLIISRHCQGFAINNKLRGIDDTLKIILAQATSTEVICQLRKGERKPPCIRFGVVLQVKVDPVDRSADYCVFFRFVLFTDFLFNTTLRSSIQVRKRTKPIVNATVIVTRR